MKLKIVCLLILLLSGTQILALDFLCPYADKQKILNCTIEFGEFTQTEEQIEQQEENRPEFNQSSLIIAEYNVDRNGYGGDSPFEKGLENIASIFDGQHQKKIPSFDVIVLSEMARDCKDYGNNIDGPKELAKMLNMSYIYVVEFIDLDQTNATNQCTIGNAILTKHKIIQKDQLRFKNQCCMFPHRLGGRITGLVEILVNNKDRITIQTTHLESGTGVEDLVEAMTVRGLQSVEMALLSRKYHQTSDISLIVGDFNSPLRQGATTGALKLFGYKDAHSVLPFYLRGTCPFDTLSKIGLDTYDYIFGKTNNLKPISFAHPQVCNKRVFKTCYGASDHYPIWATVLY